MLTAVSRSVGIFVVAWRRDASGIRYESITHIFAIMEIKSRMNFFEDNFATL